MKRLLTILLIASILLPCLLTGCNPKQPEETTPEVTTPEVTTPEITTPEVTTPEDTRVTYTVTVVDENNAPLTGATVQLCVGDICRLPALTGANGVATFQFDADNYTVKVTLNGYNGETSYTFPAGSTELTVQLTKIPEETTPEVTTPEVTTPEETTLEVTTPEVTSPEVTSPEETTPEVTSPEETTPEETTPEAPEMKLTTVTVTTGEDMTEIYAGAEMLAYLQKKGVPYAADGFPISINIDPSLGMDSFIIEATLTGDNVGMTVRGGNGRGVLYGVYRFLEKYAGFRYLAPGLETQTEEDIIIPNGLVMEHTPAILSRRISWRAFSGQIDWLLKNGINSPTISQELGGDYLNYGSLGVHTIGTLSGTTYPYPVYTSNPCLTDPEIYETVLNNLRAELEKNPNITIASVSQTDVEMWCKCPNCSKIAEEEGSYSGVWIRFVNKIATELEDEYPDLLIDTLAYKHTQTPPKITKPHKNVCVRLCSIKCCFTHPLSDPNCSEGKKLHDDIVGWGAISENVHIWDYTTNFHYYISTFANLGALRENMRFYAENNVASMFPQGNSQGQSGEFGELRAYLLAKLMWDPYMSEEEYYGYMDDFLKAYYGEGWMYVRAFIDKTTELAANGGYNINGDETEGSAVCGQGIYDHPLTVITRSEYLENEAYFDELWANALALAGDREAYVARSMMQWRLTKLYLHPNAEEAQKLIDDAKAAGVVWKEGQLNVLPESDLSKSPYYWKYGN